MCKKYEVKYLEKIIALKLQYSLFWLLCLVNGWNLFSQIVNEDTLAVMPNTTIYFANDYTNKAGAAHSKTSTNLMVFRKIPFS